ncbi:MAG: hypothetical protein LBR07_08620, partial [Puniceicoccales bacterium]|nr:hypothetical protein [Puniceicoccales bacterium]
MTADPDAQDAAFAAALAAAGTAAASVRRRRDYPLLLAGQFLGAFGDNALLAVIVGPLLFRRQSGELTEAALRDANTFYTALLFVPCVLFAPLAGYAGDRFSKNRLLVGANAIKLAGAALCAAGALLPAPVAGADPRFGSAGALLLGAGYFCVGAGTCFYGPAKYGALPEILPREKLVRGNGTVEMLTLLAVLGGFIAGSAAADVFRGAGDAVVPHLGVLGIFGVSLALNAAMSRLPNNPAVRLAATAGAFFGHARDLLVRAPRTRLLLCGTMAFWLVGAAMKTHFQPWGQGILGLSNNTEISLLALVLSVGVMAGSVLAGRLHGVGDLRATPRYALLLAAVLGIAWSVGGGGVLEFWTSPASRVTAGG